jgi:hypothetical protein
METNHHLPKYSGFPVEVGGVVEVHAAFLEESRTRGPVWCCVAGNPDALVRGAPSASLTIAARGGSVRLNALSA